jgi:glycosyltransferase involved in cell wall biosynthesis
MSGGTILHVISTLAVGGAEMLLIRLVPQLVRVGYTNIVLVLGEDVTLKPALEEHGASVISIGMTAGRPPSLSHLRRLRTVVRNLRADVIHGWMPHGCLAALAIRHLVAGRPPVIWAMHQTLYDLRDEKLLTRLIIRILAACSGVPQGILYVSKVSQVQHAAIGFRNDVEANIPNGIDLNLFAPAAQARERARATLGLSLDVPVIGHVGRFHPMKDYATLLNCAHEVIERQPNTRFVLVGREVTLAKSELRQLVENGPGQGQIALLGPRSDVHAILPAFDLLCLSSAWGEAFPTILLEAMACEVPCVVTDVGDSAEIVGSTGRVVRPADPAALADAICELMQLEPAERILKGREARRQILDKYGIEAIASSYAELYQRLMNPTAAAAYG